MMVDSYMIECNEMLERNIWESDICPFINDVQEKLDFQNIVTKSSHTKFWTSFLNNPHSILRFELF